MRLCTHGNYYLGDSEDTALWDETVWLFTVKHALPTLRFSTLRAISLVKNMGLKYQTRIRCKTWYVLSKFS